MTKISGLSLFSGIGGIDMALSDWVNPIAYCEIDKYAQAVLLSRIGDRKLQRAPIVKDIRGIDKNGYFKRKTIDIIYGGFPCQDISVAGRGIGIEGFRSGLFFEIMRLVDEFKPKWVFLENVPAIRTRGLNRVLQELTQRGYDCKWTMLSAKEVGACHKRERWFLLANSNSNRRWVQQEQTKRQAQTDISHYGENKFTTNTSGKRLERQRESFRVQQTLPTPCGFGMWTSQPSVRRGNNGLRYRSHRLKCLGNAVVPIQAKEAFKRLTEKTA